MGQFEDSLNSAFGDEFGFTPKETQITALKQIMKAYDDGYKNVILVAPTGAGKSILGMGTANAYRKLGLRSHYITSMRSLQTQIAGDFSELEHNGILGIIKGKSNYPCSILKETTFPYDAITSPCNDSDGRVNIGHFRSERHLQTYPTETDHRFLDKSTTEAALDFLDRPSKSYEGWALKRECSETGRCPYMEARSHAEEAEICLINLPAYITWNMTYTGPTPFFQARDLNIFDECHKLEDWIRESLTLSISENSLNAMFNVLFNDSSNLIDFKDFLPGSTPEEKEKAEFTEAICFKIVKSIDLIIRKAMQHKMRKKGLDYQKDEDVAQFLQEIDDADDSTSLNRAMKILKTIAILRECVAKDKNSLALEVVEVRNGAGVLTGRNLLLKAVTFPPSVTKLYGDPTQKNLFMSATIPNAKVFCFSNNLNPKETKFIELDSTFPKEHRPIFFDTIAHFTHKVEKEGGQMLTQQVADKIQEIIEHFAGMKGLIHSGSFKRQQDIMMCNDFGLMKNMLWSTRGGGQQAAEEHINRKDEPTVLIGPNFIEGVDLKHGLARFQIILKCPFPVHTDPVIKKKSKKSPGYYDSLVATQIMQMVGRTTRSESDWSVTIVLDEAVKKHITEKWMFYPKYFRDAVNLTGRWQDCDLDQIEEMAENHR